MLVPLGELTALSRPSIMGPTSKKRGGRGREKGRAGEGMGEGKEEERGKGRGKVASWL